MPDEPNTPSQGQPPIERTPLEKEIPEGGPNQDERLWSVLSHVTFFIIPIIGPLLIWLLHDAVINYKSTYIEHHAKQAMIYQIAAMVLIIGLTVVTCGLGAFLTPLFMICPIFGAIASNKGEWYAYPGLAGVTGQG